MIVLPIVILIIAAAGAAALVWLHFRKRKYADFVARYSVALAELERINSAVRFVECKNCDLNHTYDYEKSYDNISCEDYLIYELQYRAKEMAAQIDKADTNCAENKRYRAAVDGLRRGEFSAPIGKLKREKLLRVESELIQMRTLPAPTTEFSVAVSLACARMNGVVYRRKSDVFYAADIVTLCRRLRNKSGNWFNDGKIWDAICRVERGKVTNKLRFWVYARDGYRCRKCGATQNRAVLEVDHIIPIAKGGKSTPDNLQTLCHRCNVRKGDKLEW